MTQHFRFLYIICCLLLINCQSKQESTETSDTTAVAVEEPVASLEMQWETDTLMTTCESVLFNPGANVLYVANINGAPDGKDGNGFIATVALDGSILNQKWAVGLDAPKGMGLSGGHLYVTDLSRVVQIDTTSGKTVRSIPVSGAVFLNDITVDDGGTVYVSDSRAGMIAKIENGQAQIWMDSLAGPNGLLAVDGGLMTALWDEKTLNTINLESNEISPLADGIENPDGIEALGGGDFLVSSWNGMIHLVEQDGSKTLLLDTRAGEINAADIEYIEEKNLVLVPTFFKNKVVAYHLER